jgi:hypothetical protein
MVDGGLGQRGDVALIFVRLRMDRATEGRFIDGERCSRLDGAIRPGFG